MRFWPVCPPVLDLHLGRFRPHSQDAIYHRTKAPVPIPCPTIAVHCADSSSQVRRALGIHVFLGRGPSRHGVGRRERYPSEYPRGRAAKAAAFVVATRCLPARARLLVIVLWQVRSDSRAGLEVSTMRYTLAMHDMHVILP